ncbi:MAG: monovalent cation/H(+) antiporter subunit G [Cryobacterium sp.]|nr:monovalent cation/H(+) antiporter subunit G [Cryobacterium sp.]
MTLDDWLRSLPIDYAIVDGVLDLLTGVFVLVGAFLSLAAGIGLIRFPDAIARMHATTKPQIAGITFIIAGLVLQDRTWQTFWILFAVLFFQLLTAPISAHMVGRAGYRTGVMKRDRIFVDELRDAVEHAQDEAEEAAETGAIPIQVPSSDAARDTGAGEAEPKS